MFPLVFFLAVELPSMAAIALHHGFAKATGRTVGPVNIWVYRVTGIVGAAFLLQIVMILGVPAVVLLVAAVVGFALYSRRGNTASNPQPLQRSHSDTQRAAYTEVKRRPPSEAERDAYVAWLKYWNTQPIPPDVSVQIGLSSRCCAQRPCGCGRNEWVPCELSKMLAKPPMPDGWRVGHPIPSGATLRAVDWPPSATGVNRRMQYFGPPSPTSPRAADSRFTGQDRST